MDNGIGNPLASLLQPRAKGEGFRGHGTEFGPHPGSRRATTEVGVWKREGLGCWLPFLLGGWLSLPAWLKPQPLPGRKQCYQQEKVGVGLRSHQLCSLTWLVPTDLLLTGAPAHGQVYLKFSC